MGNAEVDQDGQYANNGDQGYVVEHGSNIRVEMPVNPAAEILGTLCTEFGSDFIRRFSGIF